VLERAPSTRAQRLICKIPNENMSGRAAVVVLQESAEALLALDFAQSRSERLRRISAGRRPITQRLMRAFQVVVLQELIEKVA